MIFSIPETPRHYGSEFFLCSATNKRYVLERYPSRKRGTAEYNPLYDTFQPLTSQFNYQRQHRSGNIYEKPNTIYYDNDQRQQVFSRPRNTASSPTSEIEFIMDKLGGDKNVNQDLERGQQPQKTKRRTLLHNLFDFIAIAATCLIFGLIYLLIKPTQRGFYCDDTSIQYPNKPDTIPMWLLGIYGGIGPVVIFFIVEIWVVRPFHCGRGPSRKSLKQRRVDYLKTILESTFLFLLGIAICFLITEVGKRTIGRLRPYYLTICNPIWTDIQCTKSVTTASGVIQIPQYVIDHHCNTTASATQLQEAKLSFPSGHSSYSTFAFVFLFVYFEARLVCPKIQFLKPFLQCLCIAVAFFTCLSRVTDFKHHPTDVIGGAIIGFCIAVFAAVRVGTYLWSFSVYCETEDETEKDRLPDEERIPVPAVKTKQNGSLRVDDHLQLESIHQSPTMSRARNSISTRSTYDNNSSMQPNQHHRSGPYPMGSNGRRIAPESANM
ncbi:unnamed protein product [Adineta ricciae]|uniref:Phosphatidic acid phosphatase type 2/haloperoxidase domain-containing protein n=1 Tax=Adineta ricciae TaxID=249248 RepID=A0A814P671_ADIRI|nr:unnamed protein product [Adineta ricciae]